MCKNSSKAEYQTLQLRTHGTVNHYSHMLGFFVWLSFFGEVGGVGGGRLVLFGFLGGVF